MELEAGGDRLSLERRLEANTFDRVCLVKSAQKQEGRNGVLWGVTFLNRDNYLFMQNPTNHILVAAPYELMDRT